MAKGRIVVDDARCKGCALCTSACPHDILHMADDRLNARGYHPVYLLDPDSRCTGCALCAVICPEACIQVYRITTRRASVVTV